MASKTSNVVARVEPEIKEQAEEIMAQLGIPVSVVINMLYKRRLKTGNRLMQRRRLKR